MPSRLSRSALARARFFLQKAQACKPEEREDFEAFVEATIVFARAAMHRLQSRYRKHPAWDAWWSSLKGNTAVEFFRVERDWILKDAAPKMGQHVFAPTLGGPGAYVPKAASEFYFFEPGVAATQTLDRPLIALEALLAAAEINFA